MYVRSCIPLLLSSLFVLSSHALSGPAYAQDSQPASSWWNPATWGSSSADSSVRTSSYFNGESKKEKSDKPSLSLPSLPWSSSESTTAPTPTPSHGPSLLSKMERSTQKAWHKTTDFLNPFNDAPPPKLQQGYQPQNLRKTTSSGSGLFGWMWREEKTEQPASVNDFLRMERPRF
ncbi:MAG: hypothetical protein ABI557_16835 [Aureliella sp.]